MFTLVKKQLIKELADIKEKNLYKIERFIESAQGTEVLIQGKKAINFCSNNYLGLANDPEVIAIAKKILDEWGYGLSSVRFICGTQEIHKQLEEKISQWLGTDDTILYSSCFDANAGFFETLSTKEDVIISDKLNHASIIDGIRLSKAERKLFEHMDMASLEVQLKESSSFRRRIVVTDGVFSMDGDIAPLKEICDLADRYEALVMVDDSHATGVIGKSGKGSIEHCGVIGRVDVITSTFGKALGGASGGFTSGKKEVIDYLRQRSRPYLFSNSLAPMITGTSLAIIKKIEKDTSLISKLQENTAYFRGKIADVGLDVRAGIHPIIPVMLYEARHAQAMASELIGRGIYVIGFFYPVVPEEKARIRVQISAAHSTEQLDTAIRAFAEVGKKMGLLNS